MDELEGQVYLDLVLSLNLHSSKARSCPSYECVFSIDAVRSPELAGSYHGRAALGNLQNPLALLGKCRQRFVAGIC
jgi:hypothetical protein